MNRRKFLCHVQAPDCNAPDRDAIQPNDPSSLRNGGRSHSTLAKHEIDRMRGNLPKLGLIAEGAFEHRQSAGHGDDM